MINSGELWQIRIRYFHIWNFWLAPGEPPVEKHAQQMLPGGRVGRAVSLDRLPNKRERTNENCIV